MITHHTYITCTYVIILFLGSASVKISGIDVVKNTIVCPAYMIVGIVGSTIIMQITPGTAWQGEVFYK